MNASNFPALRAVACLCTLICVLPSASPAATDLQIQLYPGLSITGTVGSVHSIEYSTNLVLPSWSFLTNIQLTGSPHFHVDSTAPLGEQRFYRTAQIAPTSFEALQLLPEREQRFFRTAMGLPELVWIVPGNFVMGSPADELDRASDEGPQTLVTLPRGFYMGKFETTQAEYQTVMGVNSSGFPSNPTLPMEMVNWTEAMTYCSKLTLRERGAGRLPAGWGYRLPTEAEWEYACRAGTTTRYSFGNDSNGTNLVNYAWASDPDLGRTHPVGTKLPNPWGLHDMHGNVWELCLDAFTYTGGSVTNPRGTGTARMSRGGSWHSYAPRCRSATRNPYTTTGREAWVGFRVVLIPAP